MTHNDIVNTMPNSYYYCMNYIIIGQKQGDVISYFDIFHKIFKLLMNFSHKYDSRTGETISPEICRFFRQTLGKLWNKSVDNRWTDIVWKNNSEFICINKRLLYCTDFKDLLWISQRTRFDLVFIFKKSIQYNICWY